MKKLKLMLIFFPLFSILSYSQVVWTDPAFPTENDSIVVYFNAAVEPGGELAGYTGQLYAHTGVITTNSSDATDWKGVIGTWGNNSTQPFLERTSANIYKLTIGHPRDFYSGLADGESILQLAFVFRSADGTKQSRPNIYFTLATTNFNLSIDQPATKPSLVKIGDSFDIRAISSNADTLKLYIDNSLVKTVAADTLVYPVTVSSYGKHNYKAIAVNNSIGEIADSSYYFAREEVIIEELPEGTVAGINYTGSSTATLALFAPKKEYVFLIGDFNNWEINNEYLMKLTPDSTTFWITIVGLNESTEYGFQYFVDGSIKIADPYADKILDPWNDSYISNSTYPGLKQYPVGKTSEIVSVLQTGQALFNWEVENYEKPKVTDLVIYELLLRDFIAEHDFKSLTDSLDYIQNLGVNAIELMPVNEFEGNESWGYNPSFYFAPDKYYGPKNDLKKFIDECHKRGIAVILDLVLNHVYGQSPMVRLYPDGNDSPWFNKTAPHTDFAWGYDFNHESQATKDLVDRINSYWLTEYKFDGFRFDFTRGFTNKPGGSGPYDESRINIIKRMADKIWETDSTAIVILEHLVDSNSEMKELADYGMLLWGNYNYNYSEAAMGYHDNNKSDFSGMSYKLRNWDSPHLVGYMESHDEERLMYKNISYGNSGGGYNIQTLETALARQMLASAFFYTIPGPKMLWQFGELGYDFSINYPSFTSDDRLTPKPIRWDYFSETNRKNLYKVTAELIKLKKEYEAFETEDFTLQVASNLKAIYLYHESMDVVIAGNFDVAPKSFSTSFRKTGYWYDYFTGDSLLVEKSQVNLPLEAGEFKIYTTVKLPTPERGILPGDNGNEEPVPDNFVLGQNYPNPFNEGTTIKYGIPAASHVSLKIYNIIGQEIKTLVSAELPEGNYIAGWNGTDSRGRKVASGVYFYRLITEGFAETKKMILLK